MEAAREAGPPGEAGNAIRARLRALAEDASLLAADAFRARCEAMDVLESEVLDRLPASASDRSPPSLPGLPTSRGTPSPAASLREDALRLMERWESLDALLFRSLRARLRASSDPGGEFRILLEAHFPARERRGPAAPGGYDDLDAFLNGLLHPRAMPAESLSLESGMVAYQKTPARIALEVIARSALAPGNFFFDVGSGLGQVPILAHLLTGARAIGVEREPAYVDYARACVSDLGISPVEFRAGDAREADYAAADVLFFYTPFRGPILAEVLDRIRRQARNGVRVFAFGPCAADLARLEWLAPLDAGRDARSELRGFLLNKTE